MSSFPLLHDILIAGAGSSALVVASRLSVSNPSLSIGIIESGSLLTHDKSIVQPVLAYSNLFPDPKSDRSTFVVGQGGEKVGGRTQWSCYGSTVGGSSCISLGAYTRGSASDFDSWRMEGWTAKDLLPLYRKSENYQIPGAVATIHGSDGPVKVSYGGNQLSVGAQFIQAARAVGVPFKTDAQDFATSNAVFAVPKYIDNRTGTRTSSLNYLLPLNPSVHSATSPSQPSANPNLHILTQATVVRVLLSANDPPNAEGFEVETRVGGRMEVRARMLCVLGCGALGSSIVLERSGVGRREVLERAGIPCRVDLRGVGECLMDHPLMVSKYRTSLDQETLDPLFTQNPETVQRAEKDFIEGGRGLLTTNGIDAGAKLRPTNDEITSMNSPSFQSVWNNSFSHFHDKPLVCLTVIATLVINPNSPKRTGIVEKGFQVLSWAAYPESRGSIHINSPAPGAQVTYDPGFLSNDADMAPLVWGYKKAREIVRRMTCLQGELADAHPKFAPYSSARVKDLNNEWMVSEEWDPIKEPENEVVTYSEEDNKAIEEWIRNTVATTYHSMGTCAMKSRDQNGVVDSRLNVYGVNKLKVIDMSIIPAPIGGHLYASALMVGEKGAIIIANDIGLAI
ncbi:GMC oxidoreductase [Atractiella rhizophila]|nr:GMC oxidoreductase [Atractiella rhizophila]